MFTFDLEDDSGRVRCIAFNQEAEQYFERLQVGKVYIISNVTVDDANIKYNELKHQYEVKFNSKSKVEEGNENDPTCPQVRYSFIPIRELNEHSHGIVDVVAVVTNVGRLLVFSSDDNDTQYKRTLNIIDHSKITVNLHLWGNLARDFNCKPGCIVIA